MATNKKIKIAITSGDQDGIGPEVTAKALQKIGPQKDVTFFLWRSPIFGARYLRLIDKKFKRLTVSSWPEALRTPISSHKQLIDICSSTPPPVWVESSAQAALLNSIDAIVTAPLSKTLIAESGLKDVGHTDILARISKKKNLFMSFIGSQFHVLLATGHIPLKDVSASLSPALLERSLLAAYHLVRALDSKNKNPRIALVGLNPHAGETGLIGLEEQTLMQPLLDKLRASQISVDGPLVPDAAFLPNQQKKIDIYVTPYHDLGLVPFKLVHQRTGCHLTLGLPFLRTSVDHGTAKDLFGKNKADSSSMQQALSRAIVLSRFSFKPDEFLRASSETK